MKENFRFKLKRVLDIRSLEEKLAHNRLREVRRQLQEVEGILAGLNRDRDDLMGFILHNELSVEENIQVRNYLQIQNKKIEATKMSLVSKQEEAEERRQEYYAKRKERRVLEKLQEKKYRQFQQQLLQKEQKELDEMGQRFQGRTGGMTR